MNLGESSVIGTLASHGQTVTGVLAPVGEKNAAGREIRMVCLLPNSVHQLTNIPVAVREEHGLVGDTALVTFVEGKGDADHKMMLDRFRFDNGSEVWLNRTLDDVTVKFVAKNMEEFLSPHAEQEIPIVQPAETPVSTAALVEGELVRVGGGRGRAQLSRGAVLAGSLTLAIVSAAALLS